MGADSESRTRRRAPTAKPPNRLGRPRDEHADKAILDATLAELEETGYQGMSIDGIARRAGVSKPTIYRRWPNKPALAIGAIRMLVDREGPVSTGDTRQDLRRQLQHSDDNLHRSNSVTLLGTLLAECDRHPSFMETYRSVLVGPRHEKIIQILQLAQERGEIRADADLDTAAWLIMGVPPTAYLLSGKPIDRDWLGPSIDLVLEALR